MKQLKFKIFGFFIAVNGERGAWQAHEHATPRNNTAEQLP